MSKPQPTQRDWRMSALEAAYELLDLKNQALAALLKAGDAAQAEIKRLQGLLDKK